MKRETIEVGTVTACCPEWVSSLLLLMSIKNSAVNAKKIYKIYKAYMSL